MKRIIIISLLLLGTSIPSASALNMTDTYDPVVHLRQLLTILQKMPAAVDGKDGRNGTNGVDGKDGINGKDGKDGDVTFLYAPLVGLTAINVGVMLVRRKK